MKLFQFLKRWAIYSLVLGLIVSFFVAIVAILPFVFDYLHDTLGRAGSFLAFLAFLVIVAGGLMAGSDEKGDGSGRTNQPGPGV